MTGWHPRHWWDYLLHRHQWATENGLMFTCSICPDVWWRPL